MNKELKKVGIRCIDGYSPKLAVSVEGYQPPKPVGIAQPNVATGGYQPTKGVSTQQTGIKPPVKK